MDPVTKNKIKLLKWEPKEELLNLIDDDQLLVEYGGKAVRTSTHKATHVENVETSDVSLEEMFSKTVQQVSSNSNLSDEQTAELYGLYQQATQGDVNVASPWAVQFEARTKWEAWNKVKGTSKEEAMEKYIQFVIENINKQ